MTNDDFILNPVVVHIKFINTVRDPRKFNLSSVRSSLYS